MRLLKPSFSIIDANSVLRNIELGGRVCYRSEDKIGPGSDVALIEKLKNFKHESVLEHGVITIQFSMDRGVSHEQVRHRHTSPSQESTRYCNYSKNKFDNQISVIQPFFFYPDATAVPVTIPSVRFDSADGTHFCLSDDRSVVAFMCEFDVWMVSCLWAEWAYNTLTQQFKRSAQEARSVLPNSLATRIQITANVREWRHILALRTNRDAHPQMRQIMVPLGWSLAKTWPCLFGEYANGITYHPAPAEEVQQPL